MKTAQKCFDSGIRHSLDVLGRKTLGARSGPGNYERPGNEPDLGSQTLGRLSERTLGGSSPPATCAAQVTKEVEENEPQHFRASCATLRRPPKESMRQCEPQHRHPSTRPISAASTASNGATLPSSAVRQASNASIRCRVDSDVDLRASTAICGLRSSLINGAPEPVWMLSTSR